MLLVVGFIAGIAFSIISLIVVLYFIPRNQQVIMKAMDTLTVDKATIVYPDYSQEIFKKEGTTLDDNLL